jgi:hypothetical protein
MSASRSHITCHVEILNRSLEPSNKRSRTCYLHLPDLNSMRPRSGSALHVFFSPDASGTGWTWHRPHACGELKGGECCPGPLLGSVFSHDACNIFRWHQRLLTEARVASDPMEGQKSVSSQFNFSHWRFLHFVPFTILALLPDDLVALSDVVIHTSQRRQW